MCLFTKLDALLDVFENIGLFFRRKMRGSKFEKVADVVDE